LCLSKCDAVESHCELVANEGLSTEDAVLARKMTAHTHTYAWGINFYFYTYQCGLLIFSEFLM